MSQLGLSGDSDPVNQLKVITAELDGTLSGYYYKNSSYPNYYTSDFVHSTESPEFLARVYQVCRERNRNIQEMQARQNSAKEWFSYLYDYYYYFQNGGNPYGNATEDKEQTNPYPTTYFIPKRWYK